MNKNAIYLPIPLYPLEARNTVPAGMITVRVEVNEHGNVTKANACAGHPLLRPFAEAAALKAKIKQTKLSGISVKVGGVLNYKFDPERSYDAPYELPCFPTMNFIKVVNPYAIDLVKADYPKELTWNLVGSVAVQVMIDENGKVVEAQALPGPQQFRKNAVEAAKKSTFRRFERCGKPVKLTSVLGYNFLPPK